MRIFQSPPIIFVHIPKTGGTSVTRFLDENIEDTTKVRLRGPASLHSTLSELNRAIDDSILDFDIISVKRNTWERILSYYLMANKFPRIPELRDKNPVSFEDYYTAVTKSTEHLGDIFHFCEIGNGIPDNVTFLDFNNLETDLYEFWGSRGFTIVNEFQHLNKNTNVEDYIRSGYLRDQKFIDTIGKKYRREIDYFGFEPPQPG